MSKTIKSLLAGLLAGFVVMALFGYWIWQEREVKGFTGNELPIQSKTSHNATSTYTSDNDDDNDGGYVTATSSWMLLPQSVIDAWDSGSEKLPSDHRATTTIGIDITNASVLTVGLQVVASSTASVINVEAQISRDGSNWYEFIPTAVSNTVNTSDRAGFEIASSTLFSYSPNNDGGPGDATSTPSFSLDLRNTVANHMRLFFGAGAGTTTVRAELMVR